MSRQVFTLDTLDDNERMPPELLQLLRDIEKHGEAVLACAPCCAEGCVKFGGDSITVQFDTTSLEHPTICLQWQHSQYPDNRQRVAHLRRTIRNLLPDWAQHFTIVSV